MTRPPQVPVPDALVSLLDRSPDPFFSLDPHGVFVYANAAAAAMVHLTPADLIGRSLEADFGFAFSPTWLDASRCAQAEQRPVQYDAFNPAFGGWVQVQVVPGASGLGVHIRNVTEQHRTAALQRFTAALTSVQVVDDVVKALMHEATTAAGALTGSLVVPSADGEHLQLLDEVNYPAALRARFERFPLSLDIPVCDAARRRVPVFISGEQFDRAYPDAVGVRGEQTRSLAALPLLLNGTLWGVLSLSFQEERHFDEPERTFLQTLVTLATQALIRVNATVYHQQQAELLGTLNRVNRLVSAELDLGTLVQAVTDASVELTGAAFGAFFYNVVNQRQESYTLYTLSGAPREAFAGFPMPRNTQVFGPTFAGDGVMRVADITQDPRYGHNAPHHGMPEGHLPVRSYLAVPVVSRRGEVLGGLFFGHPEPGVFDDRAEQLALGLATQTAVALDNARLYQQLQDSHTQLEGRVRQRTEELEAQATSLDAFAALTEAVGSETNVRALARQAIAVLRTRFPDDAVGYYAPDGPVWTLREWSDNMDPAVVRSLQAGLPSDTPAITSVLRTRTPVYVDGWDADREQVERSEGFGAVGAFPLVVEGDVLGILSMGRTGTSCWTERDKALFGAVGRSFTLALERAAQTTHMEAQRDALDARSRALEAFALLTRDLTTAGDSLALVRRAQEILMSLLPEGYALYWQPEQARWVSRSQVGQLGDPDLQRAVDAGLLRGHTAPLDRAWQTRQPVFEDTSTQGADTDPDVAPHVRAAAMLPVLVNGAVHGLLGVGVLVQRQWTPMDQAVLETVSRSLGLALEGAESAQALRLRTRDLERSNAELERFAYVASHDLQEPLRTVASFAELIDLRYSAVLDERGRRYLHLVSDGAQRMKTLIDDLLVFSRLGAVHEPQQQVALHDPLREALRGLQAAVEHSGAVVTHDPLPSVNGSPSQLTQLFQNLLGNAIKFRREDVPPEIHVAARREPDGWRLTVQDNGIGFEPQYAERVFQMFQRLHMRQHYAGNGMGLAIVRKIVEHHGGRIWVDTRPGEGSAFHFTLPHQSAQ
ncbi:GAF domain-containing protein [Deinococcus sonorensis]|uniref:histidine kinase n=2 Tax=Deinococcus sonorensis TaxID=309891 RepID=A0AAU7U6P6_9DEIO